MWSVSTGDDDVCLFVYAVVQHFLQELSQEKLSHGREVQRQASLKAVQGIMKKIQHSHPSIRPRVNTPATMKKPPLPPPAEIPGGPPTVPEEEHEGEVYEEPATDIPAEAEDYLSFEPAQTANGLEESQEMYEAMEVTQEVYEEPGEYEQVHIMDGG